MRRAAGEKCGQGRERHGEIEGVALAQAELAGLIAEPLNGPDRSKNCDRRGRDHQSPACLRGRQDEFGERHQKTLIATTKPATTSAANPPSTAAKLRSIAARNGSPNQWSAPATRKNCTPRVSADRATNSGKL